MIDRATLDRIPTAPGAYLLRGDAGEVLYIGKAKSLRTRVRSYFRRDRNRGIRLAELSRRSKSVETIVVGSEEEALILEANLIREHRPPFNIQLRDDKRYPYIKVTVQEPFPRVFVTRRLRQDGARYFGPYTSVGQVRQALELMKRLYTVRSCRYDLPREAPARPCLDYHIGRCKAPCVGLQSESDYRSMTEEILRVLEGRTDSVRATVWDRMNQAARDLRFEDAARQRDILAGLDAISQEQRVESASGGDRDVLGIARDGKLGTAVVLRVRGGALLGRESHRFTELVDEGDADLLSTFAAHLYLGRGIQGDRALPREVLLPADFPDRQLLEGVLSDRAGRKVRVRVPSRGEARRLVELAGTNAQHLLEQRVIELEVASDPADAVLYRLQDRLGLKVVPRLIYCVDVSHTQGSDVVASVVAFESGQPKKALYRRMRIRGEWGNDDYRSMGEAVQRLIARRMSDGAPLPELIVLDGGKGQLSAVQAVLRDLGASDISLVAIAKKQEELFIPGGSGPIRLSRRDPALRLLQRLRNEAHRFAVTYGRHLRGTRTLRTELDEIPGVGPARSRRLLSRFGSVKGVREAGEAQLASVPGFSQLLARRVLEHLGA